MTYCGRQNSNLYWNTKSIDIQGVQHGMAKKHRVVARIQYVNMSSWNHLPSMETPNDYMANKNIIRTFHAFTWYLTCQGISADGGEELRQKLRLIIHRLKELSTTKAHKRTTQIASTISGIGLTENMSTLFDKTLQPSLEIILIYIRHTDQFLICISKPNLPPLMMSSY